MADREFILKFLGDTTGATRAFDELDRRLGGHGAQIAAVTAAGATLGAGIEGLARREQDRSATVARLTELTGLQSGAVRTLATDLASVDSPLEEVLATMEQGTRVGVTSAEGLRQYAEFWDLVGNASGIAADQLSGSTSVLQTVGIDVNNLAAAENALGFVLTDTTAGVDGFLGLLERKGPAISEFGLNVNDAAALTAIFERELGFAGRAGLTEFERALDNSDGTLGNLLQNIGVSEETFLEYRRSVDQASGSLDNIAEANTSTFTTMQELEHMVSEVTFRFGDQIAMASNLVPLLLGIGPAFGVIRTGASLLSGASGLGALLPLIAPPQGLILLGLAAIVTAGVLVWQNWDNIKEKAGQLAGFLGDKLGPMKDFVVGVFGDIADAVMGVIDRIGDFFEMLQNIPSAGDVAGAIGSRIPGSGSGFADAVGGFFGGVFDEGGVVPGPRGAKRLIIAHAGETILPTHTGRFDASGGAIFEDSGLRFNPGARLDTSQVVDNRTVNVHIHGNTIQSDAQMEALLRRALTNVRLRGFGA